MKKKNDIDGTKGKPEPKVIVISDATQLQGLCTQPIYAEFQIGDEVVRIECRRVSAALDEEVRKLRRVVPPYDEKRKDYDYMNPVFLERREAADRIARSYIIYTCCPVVSQSRPGLINAQEIHKFVSGLFPENVLEIIGATIASGDIRLAERANFT